MVLLEYISIFITYFFKEIENVPRFEQASKKVKKVKKKEKGQIKHEKKVRNGKKL